MNEFNLSLIQEMLMTEIEILENKLFQFFQNKIKSIELQANLFVDVELASNLMHHQQLPTIPEIDKKTRDSFIQTSEQIEFRFDQFRVYIIGLEPEYEGGKVIPLKTLRDFVIKDKQRNEYFCPNCSASFIEQQRLQHHINHKHRYTVPCSICKIPFQDELLAWLHEQMIHTNIYTALQCIYCKASLSSMKGVRRHVIDQHYKQIRSDFFRMMQRWPQDKALDDLSNEEENDNI